MKYEELFQLRDFREGKLLAGKNILTREITGAHVIEMADGINWASHGELIFTSGVGFTNPYEDLKLLMNTVAQNDAAGLVVEVGPYIKEIPEALIDFSNELNIPLFTLPYNVQITNIISQIFYHVYNSQEYSHSVEKFMQDTLYSHADDIVERSTLYHFDNHSYHVALFLSYDDCQGSMTHLHNAIHMSSPAQESLLSLVKSKGIHVILDLPDAPQDLHQQAEKKRQEIQKCYRMIHKSGEISMGVGCPFQSITEYKHSASQAEEAYKLIRLCNGLEQTRLYEELGIYQMLFRLQDDPMLSNIYQTQLGALLLYDKENETDLVHTLEVYLQCNCNITTTTENLYVHRNTVKYRLKRINELLGGRLDDVNLQFNLRLAYKINKFYSN